MCIFLLYIKLDVRVSVCVYVCVCVCVYVPCGPGANSEDKTRPPIGGDGGGVNFKHARTANSCAK